MKYRKYRVTEKEQEILEIVRSMERIYLARIYPHIYSSLHNAMVAIKRLEFKGLMCPHPHYPNCWISKEVEEMTQRTLHQLKIIEEKDDGND